MQIGKKSSILTICAAGIVRSVAMKYELVGNRGYKNVQNLGLHCSDKDVRDILMSWADLMILTAEQDLYDEIPFEYRGKTSFVDIGKDHWHNPNDPELQKLMKKVADQIGL